MTQEEFYIRLMNCNSDSNIKLPEFNPEFLKNYEIAKLVLDKIGIKCLSENQQKNLNLEAVLTWFNLSEFIELKYDIPEILELLPERIRGYLGLWNSQIQSLPELKSVGGDLFLIKTKIKSLPQLESVEGRLNLWGTPIQSLPELKSVGHHFILRDSQIQSLPKLESVEGRLNLSNSQVQSLPKLEHVGGEILVSPSKEVYWENYFNKIGRGDLAKSVAVE